MREGVNEAQVLTPPLANEFLLLTNDFLVIIARSSHVQDRGVVGIDELERVSICQDFDLGSVVESLKSDGVSQGSNSSRLVLPSGRSDSRDPLVGWDGVFVDGNLAQMSSWLKVFQRMSHDRVEVDFTSKVSAQVTEVCCLFDNGTTGSALVPPV